MSATERLAAHVATEAAHQAALDAVARAYDAYAGEGADGLGGLPPLTRRRRRRVERVALEGAVRDAVAAGVPPSRIARTLAVSPGRVTQLAGRRMAA
ncbi:hypothetical protein GXB85_13435 [Cellulomonas sp. APG4]|uniref:hypothetical protein n=1 Tax=Cellulomonas sp. APG4 TaxID=1538656 RepID=UPI00137AE998|nr:hypothetical protein [Cellulomonas sp. APG4]NCT91945.1 hypothetical protein [Cellulomonas sp. APG4]